MRTDILERKQEILDWIEQNQSKAFICKQLKCKPETLNGYLQKMNIDYKGNQGSKGIKSGFGYKTAIEYSQGVSVKSHILKLKLIRDGLKEDKCEICGISSWNGVKLPLELHHKDGNHFNNDLNNLQILCPNCHSIQNGNSGANVGKYAAMQEQVDYSLLEGEVNDGVGVQVPVAAPLNKKKYYCKDCGKEITNRGYTLLCQDCYRKSTRKVERPERTILKQKIREQSFLSLSNEYGVSDNAIRKWCKAVNLPTKKTEINAYSDEEWELI